jgi:hypothetical protein
MLARLCVCLVSVVQASEDMRRLARRTASAVGAASQGAVTRQQMQELLHFATGGAQGVFSDIVEVFGNNFMRPEKGS